MIDRRIKQLQNSLALSEKDLRKTLGELALSYSPERKLQLYHRVQVIVGSLRRNMRAWAQRYTQLAYADAERSLRRALGDAAPEAVVASPYLEALVRVFLERVDPALLSVQNLAGRLLRSPDPVDALGLHERQAMRRLVNAGASAADASAKVLKKFAQEVVQRPVSVLGQTTGRVRRYSLSYYLPLVASSALVQAKNLPARLYAQIMDLDLVRISDNPSMHGDWCDDYAGKVFSLSGKHPVFPWIGLTPNGGSPFHVNCTHTMSSVMPWEVVDSGDAAVHSALLQTGESTGADIERRRRHKR